MGIVHPVTKEKAAGQLHPIYDALTQKFGRMPNIFATMAKRPDVLSAFLPFMKTVMEENSLEPRYRELAYLRTSMLNGCDY